MNNITFGKGKQADLKAQVKGNQVNQSANQECIELLEKCQQIIRDDKNILRQLIKDGNSQVISIIKNKKKCKYQNGFQKLKSFTKLFKQKNRNGLNADRIKKILKINKEFFKEQ